MNPDFSDNVPSWDLNTFKLVKTTTVFYLIYLVASSERLSNTSIYLPTVGSARINLILNLFLVVAYLVNIFLIIPATSISI